MKFTNISKVIIVAVLVVFSSCYYDDPPQPAPIDIEDVSFSTHILPILESSCSTANCHDGTAEPNLLESVAYNELLSGYVNLILPEESLLYKSVQYEAGADPMPPGGIKLSELDIELIRLWIVKGALND